MYLLLASTVFTFLNDRRKSKEGFVAHENYLKFKFQCP